MGSEALSTDTPLIITDTGKPTPATPEQAAWLKENEPLRHKTRVLLVKPYAPTPVTGETPPMGLICLAACLEDAFGDKIEIQVLDMKLYKMDPEDIQEHLNSFNPHIIGMSALNLEAGASKKIARIAKKHNPNIITAIGGPYTQNRAHEILEGSPFDWAVTGPGDRVFTQAIRRFINSKGLGTDIPGLNYQKDAGQLHIASAQDFIEDLDSLPLPSWKYIDFDTYAKRNTMSETLKGKRYGVLFTSRGCPYLCNYCHDIFSKRFKFQSAERVIAEIENLYENFGVDEFHIVDDIFNLHKPRVKEIMHEVHRRWPGKIHFAFPNGVRADILDGDVLDDMKLGGTYYMAIAIETATPRLQDLIQKYLDLDKTFEVIEEVDKRGIMTNGFFMLGFPTETEEEINATADYALRSKLTKAFFFTVIPQPGTPLYDLAKSESEETLKAVIRDEEEGNLSYLGLKDLSSWYERAYGFPLRRYQLLLALKFHLAPARLIRYLMRIPKKNLWMRFGMLLNFYFQNVFSRSKRPQSHPPSSGQPS
jgi:radical SAM superfamily enzyme YgiQ (UPF0313 family)